MGLEIKQSCDMCGVARKIPSLDMAESVNWRRVPIKTGLGPSRSEQPVICSDCCSKVEHLIRGGKNSLIIIPFEEGDYLCYRLPGPDNLIYRQKKWGA